MAISEQAHGGTRVADTSAPDPAFDDVTRLAALVCAAPTALITLDGDRDPAFASRHGYEPLASVDARAWSALAGREVLVVPDTMQDPRFSTHPSIRFYAGAPLAMPDGRLVGTLAVIDFAPRELTPPQLDGLTALARQVVALLQLREHVAAEHRHREGVQRFELVARATNDAVWDWDLVTNRIWWSEGMRTLFGYPPEAQPSYETWVQTMHPEDAPRVTTDIEAAIRSGAQFWSDTYRFARHDGSWADVIDRGYVLRDASGTPVRMVGAMLDVSERRRLEEQLRQSQKMDAISQLSGGIAHDFNNLLTVIQVNAALVARATRDTSLREHTNAITEATERAANLTRQLLMVSRRQIMQPRVIDLNEVVTNLTRMLHRIVGEHITLVAQPDRAMPLVEADVGMIEQVVLNLVVNARDAMPNGGQLTIVMGHKLIGGGTRELGDEVKPGTYASVSVSDTGSGIPSSDLPHIFEPFFTTKDLGRGTGLGLATAYGIVRQHHGWIDVTSTPGQGSMFRFYLPATNRQRTDRPAATVVDEDLPRGTETVLVVEDEPALRNLVVTLLGDCGYTVLQAASAAAALELWATDGDRVDLVLTDIVMPGGMNGRELAERLRAEAPELPVLYTSGYSPDMMGAGERLVEGLNFVQKPYQPARLARTVRERLDRGGRAKPRRE